MNLRRRRRTKPTDAETPERARRIRLSRADAAELAGVACAITAAFQWLGSAGAWATAAAGLLLYAMFEGNPE